MADAESVDSEPFSPKTLEVGSVNEIPIIDGFIRFDAGHTAEIQNEYDGFFDNSFSTFYKVSKPKYPELYAVVDLSKLPYSELVFNEKFMRVLLNFSSDQISNDASSALTRYELINLGDNQKQRYKWAREKLVAHSKSLADLFNRLEQANVSLVPYTQVIEKIKKSFDWKDKLPLEE